MELTDTQKAAISSWIENGADLPEIQKRLKDEFEIGLTYLETRMLADDLKLQLQEPEPSEQKVPTEVTPAEQPGTLPGKLSLTIDQIMRPGSLVSGRVVFSDGEKCEWYLDQAGRLGLDPQTPGYRPSQQDVVDFQAQLEKAARSQGL